jgi:hypothetical protein
MGLEKLAPLDMRRTCAKLCRKRGGGPEQIKFLLGHALIMLPSGIWERSRTSSLPFNDNLGLDK